MKDLNKQLWYKALDKAVPETYTHLSSEQLGKAIDVYTELIVRECAFEAFKFWLAQDDCNEESAQAHIKQYFGVEEWD